MSHNMGSSAPASAEEAYAAGQRQRAGRPPKRPKTIHRAMSEGGQIHLCDENGRLCVDDSQPFRVVLIADLRKCDARLKPGLVGRTMTGTSDFYRQVRVDFNNGVTPLVGVSCVQPIADEKASNLADAIIDAIRGTVFDWDDDVAEEKRRQWEQSEFSHHLNTAGTAVSGAGPEEVYAYTFPSLIELAQARNEPFYPIKIGYTAVSRSLSPALERIKTQTCNESLFEMPQVVAIWKTWNARQVESRVHKHLFGLGRKLDRSAGTEWYLTSAAELASVVQPELIHDSGTKLFKGPFVESLDDYELPNKRYAEEITVVVPRQTPEGRIEISTFDFDEFLDNDAPR